MPARLDSRDPGFAGDFEALLNSKREASEEVGTVVSTILADVKARGDAAVLDYTNRFDRQSLSAPDLRFTAAEIDAARARTPADVVAALSFAYDRIRAHHEKQKPADHIYTDHLGVTLGTI